jgi:RNase P/RNase MRP subunit p29
VDREQYRAVARGAGIPRPSRPRALDVGLATVLVLVAFVGMPHVAAATAAGLSQLVASLEIALPQLQGQGAIQLPSGGAGAAVAAAPIVEGLPLFTRDVQLQFSGRVPSFAVQPGRSVQIALNGGVAATSQLDQSGTFAATLALKEGANTIIVALVGDRDVVAASTYTVTLDRTAPTLVISTPKQNATVDPDNVVVQGTTKIGSTVTVNGRSVIVSPDGAFVDYSTASPGPVEITVVARDRAGNETTQKLSILAERVAAVTGPTLVVALDRTTVRPGQQVVARVLLADRTGALAGVQVTLSVGVVLIGSATTDQSGTAAIGFAAPTTEGDIGVVVLGGGTSGRATLTVSR